MLQTLAVGGYKWKNPSEFLIERINNIKDVDDTHYIFLVDL